MFQVSLFRAPTTEEKAEKAKKDKDSAKKKKGEGKERDRLVRLARFTVETDNSAEVAKVMANTLAKLAPAKQALIVGMDVRQVPKPDLNAPLF